MKEARFYTKLPNKQVQCKLCPNYCILKDNKIGKCNSRQNIKGKLYSLTYGKVAAMHVDPIEKKPLYHFLPGSQAFSIGTAGCTLHCDFCQNWELSQRQPQDEPEISPKDIVKLAKESGCKSIAYTYSEPTSFIEFALDIAKLAKKAKLKNLWISNGYINPEPLKEVCKYMDAANIDLKATTEDFYKTYCKGKLQPVLDTIETLYKKGVWVEVTNLIIPNLNDTQTKKVAEYIKTISTDIPLHYSAYYPCYKRKNPPTPEVTVTNARNQALKLGLKYVYAGNILNKEGSNTLCPNCKKLVIERAGYLVKSNLKDGKCSCGVELAGKLA